MERELDLVTDSSAPIIDLAIEKDDPFREKYPKVVSFLDRLTPGKQSPDWQRTRIVHLDKYGNESLMSMIPENLNKNSHFLVRFFNTLHGGGIETKQQLLDTSLESLDAIVKSGHKIFRFAIILKQAILEEQNKFKS